MERKLEKLSFCFEYSNIRCPLIPAISWKFIFLHRVLTCNSDRIRVNIIRHIRFSLSNESLDDIYDISKSKLVIG